MAFDVERFLKEGPEVAKRQRLAIVGAMVAAMPKKTPDAPLLAEQAYIRFERALVSEFIGEGTRLEDKALARELPRVRQALLSLDDAVAAMSPFGLSHLSHALDQRGIDFITLGNWLGTLAEVTDRSPPPSEGSRKDRTTVAAVVAAQYLMNNGINRQRAAKVIEALMQSSPSVEPKTWETIQDAMIAAGIPAKKLVKAKGWGAYR